MGAGGIIGGIIAGGLGGLGSAMAEDGRNQMKQEGDLNIMQAKAKLEAERDRALAELQATRDARLHTNDMEKQHDAQDSTSSENDKQRDFQSDQTDKQINSAKEIAMMHETGSDRRAREQITAMLDSKSIGDRVTLEDGRVIEKVSGGRWQTINDQGTGEPVKTRQLANGIDREFLSKQLSAAENDVKAAEMLLKQATTSKEKAYAQQQIDAARAKRDSLYSQGSGAMLGTTRPPAQSGVSNLPPLSSSASKYLTGGGG
jgi:hypothetical protein